MKIFHLDVRVFLFKFVNNLLCFSEFDPQPAYRKVISSPFPVDVSFVFSDVSFPLFPHAPSPIAITAESMTANTFLFILLPP